MATDYQKLYDNLTILLEDICQFLSSEKLGSLAHSDKKLVETLINRSKVQLQEIAKVTEEYVDMDTKKVSEVDEENSDMYSSVGNINTYGDNIIQEPPCPYIDLPAKHASQHEKCGFLSMKRKFLLGFEKMKRVYGSIHKYWLLIYFSDKDPKPICTFHLKNYEAKETYGPKSTQFELISTLPNGKIFHFTALTPKDMLQWVVHINRCHDNVIIQSKSLDIKDNNEDEEYDVIDPSVDKQEEDIYEELKDKPQNNNEIPTNETENDLGSSLPPLPGRRPSGRVAIPVSPPTIKTLTHLPSTRSLELETKSENSESSEDGTLSDEDDPTYDTVLNIKNKIENYQTSSPAENMVKDVCTRRKQSTFLHKNQNKNTESNPDLEPKNNCDERKSGNSQLLISNPRTRQPPDGAPPILPKVPPVRLTSTDRSRLFVGKRPILTGLRQIADDN